MEQITKTYIDIGLESPVKILHITDIHLTLSDSNDSQEHIELMQVRTESFRKTGNYAPRTPSQYFEEAIKLSDELGALLINTGDTMDIYTSGNVAEFHRIIKGHDMMYTPGGHEHQCRIMRAMEEPYPHIEEIRPKFQKEFCEYDLDFSSRIINGLNIICADNSLDYYNARTVELFKKELEKGLPIIVFSHDPLWTKTLYCTEPYHPNVRLTAEDYKTSHEMIDLLTNHPLVITTFAGHGHYEDQKEIGGKTHYMTAGLFKGMCRYIEIR